MRIAYVAQALLERLPELEWMLAKCSFEQVKRQLPKKLFRCAYASAHQELIKEINQDIVALTNHQDGVSAQYLAEKIKQKIDVLVHLCKAKINQQEKSTQPLFHLNKMTTQQQWVNAIEQEIASLSQKQQALNKTLKHKESSLEPDAVLKIQAELGALEKEITILKERYHKLSY